MSENISINKYNEQNGANTTQVDSSNRIGNVLLQGTGGNAQVEPLSDSQAAQQTNTNKRTHTELDNEFRKLAIRLKISLSQLNEALKYSGFTDEELLTCDGSKLLQIESCVERAVNHIRNKNGNVTKELSMTVISYKLAIFDKKIPDDQLEAFINKYENLTFMDILREKNPNLKGKSIEEISVNEIKDTLKMIIQNRPKDGSKRNIQAHMDYFMASLGKCEDSEKAKIFHAFALLLQDRDIQEAIPEAYQKMLKTYGSTEELTKIISKVGPEILRELGFSEKLIQILNFNALKELPPEDLANIIKSVMDVFSKIDEKDLTVLKSALEKITSGQSSNLTDDEKAVYCKYKDVIGAAATAIAVSANDPELLELLKQLIGDIDFNKIDPSIRNHIFNKVQNLFDNNSDLFNDMSKDDFIKKLNEITKNAYSEAIGDTNPDNLYASESVTGYSGSSDCFGFQQRTSSENFFAALAKENEIINSFYNENKSLDNQIYVYSNNVHKSENVTTPWQKYQSVKSLTAKDLYEGLAKNYVKIDDLLDNYKHLTQSAKDFVNGLIEIMSPGEQNFRLDGMPNSQALKIIRETNIDPTKLKLALDYASNKELERMQENKTSA